VRIHYLQHVEYEPVAAIGEWAAERGHSVSGTHLYREQLTQPDDFDMLVIMGGPMNIYDEADHPWLADEKRFVAQVVAEGKLVLGVCLGAQLLADVLGGPVTRGREPEIGWYPIELTPEARAVPAFAALPERFTPLHWHGDTFAVPPEAVRLARSETCENQAFAVDGGRVLGLQFHLEATRESWAALTEACADELKQPGESVSSAGMMLAHPFGEIRELLFAMLDAWVGAGKE